MALREGLELLTCNQRSRYREEIEDVHDGSCNHVPERGEGRGRLRSCKTTTNGGSGALIFSIYESHRSIQLEVYVRGHTRHLLLLRGSCVITRCFQSDSMRLNKNNTTPG